MNKDQIASLCKSAHDEVSEKLLTDLHQRLMTSLNKFTDEEGKISATNVSIATTSFLVSFLTEYNYEFTVSALTKILTTDE